MKNQKLTFFQNFNAMRQYLSSYLNQQVNGDISLLLSGLKLDTSREDWKKDLLTWDQAAFEDWMQGVKKTLCDLKITDNPTDVQYSEYTAFLCMKNYLLFLYQEFKFEDVAMLLDKVNSIQLDKNNLEWNHWLNCIKYVIEHENEICG